MNKTIILILIWIILYFLLDKVLNYFLKKSLIKIWSGGIEEKASEIERLIKKCDNSVNNSDYIFNLHLLNLHQEYFFYYLGILKGLDWKKSEEYEKYFRMYPKTKFFDK